MVLSIICKANNERAGGVAQNLALMLSANLVPKAVYDVLNRFAIVQSHRTTVRNEKNQQLVVYDTSKAGILQGPVAFQFDNVDRVLNHGDRLGVHNTDFHFTHIFARVLCQLKEGLDNSRAWRSRNKMKEEKNKYLFSTYDDQKEVGLYSIELVYNLLVEKFSILAPLRKLGSIKYAAKCRADAGADNDTNFPDWMTREELNPYPTKSTCYPVPLSDQAESNTPGMISILKHIIDFAGYNDTCTSIPEGFIGPITKSQHTDPSFQHIIVGGDQMSCSMLRAAQKVSIFFFFFNEQLKT